MCARSCDVSWLWIVVPVSIPEENQFWNTIEWSVCENEKLIWMRDLVARTAT